MNADDFGLDEEINRGIADCIRNGIVRSVSIVPNGAAFKDALDLINKGSDIGIGIHLCLVGEKPILPKERIPGLVDDKGFFPRNYRYLLFKIYNHKVNLLEIKTELEAQITRVLDNGVIPTHLDSHEYTHLIPPVFNIVVQLAQKYKIKWMRYPNQSKYMQFMSIRNYIKKIYLLFASDYQLAMLRMAGINYADASYGIMTNGRLNRDIIKRFLFDLSEGLNDITCHPGYRPRNSVYHSSRYQWEEEVQALNSQGVEELVKKLNIKLINYGTQKRIF